MLKIVEIVQKESEIQTSQMVTHGIIAAPNQCMDNKRNKEEIVVSLWTNNQNDINNFCESKKRQFISISD